MNRPIFLPLVLTLLTATTAAQQTTSINQGAACVVAKEQGNSLAIEWVVGANSPETALEMAKIALQQRGYKYTFPQASTNQPGGWLIIVKTKYTSPRGKQRTSYGCGFDPGSAERAHQAALRNLRSYSWAWKPELGHEIHHQQSY